MFIRLTIEASGVMQDILIDSEQKIGEALAVLRQSGKIPDGKPPDYFRSRAGGHLVSAHRTFVEESIFDGDILSALRRTAI